MFINGKTKFNLEPVPPEALYSSSRVDLCRSPWESHNSTDRLNKLLVEGLYLIHLVYGNEIYL